MIKKWYPSQMHQNKRLLIVGGTGRDVGKTEFVCRLITKTSAQLPIYALKVSSIFPDEEIYHGNHLADEVRRQLFEETRLSTEKDTSRMLRAGATKVFYLQGDDTEVAGGYLEFLNHVPEHAIIVCESNSLGQFVQPALSIMVKSRNGKIKPRAVAQLERADLVVISDCSSGFPELDMVSYDKGAGWQLQGA